MPGSQVLLAAPVQQRNTVQTAYDLQVYDGTANTGKSVWSTGKDTSDQSLFVPYGGTALQSEKNIALEGQGVG